MKRGFLTISLMILLFACNEESIIVSSMSESDYYPLVIGQYRTYEVEEIRFSLLDPDTSRFYLREVLADSIISVSGDIKYLISRYLSVDNEQFELDSIWTVQKLDRTILVTENNVPFIKLIQPFDIADTWNGNAYNTLPEVTYYYEPTDREEIELIGLDTVDLIDVIIEDIEANLVNQDERKETYADGIGLVQKDYVTLEFCTLDCGGVGEIQGGRIFKQVLIDYGNI